MSQPEMILFPRPDGTAATIEADALRALAGYVERCDAEGIRWTLGCGCGPRVTCGYHREQRERMAALNEALNERADGVS